MTQLHILVRLRITYRVLVNQIQTKTQGKSAGPMAKTQEPFADTDRKAESNPQNSFF